MSGRSRLLTNVWTSLGHLFDILFFGPVDFITFSCSLGHGYAAIIILHCDWNWGVREATRWGYPGKDIEYERRHPAEYCRD